MRHDDISSLIPAQVAHEPEEVERPEAGYSPLTKGVLSNKETKESSQGKSGYETQVPFFSDLKDSLKCLKQTGTSENGLPRSNASFSHGVEEGRLRGPLNFDSANVFATDDVVKDLSQLNQIGGSTHAEKATAKKRGVTRKARKPLASQLEAYDTPQVANCDKKRRPSRRAVTEINSAASAGSDEKLRQASILDVRRLADEVTGNVLEEIKSMRSTLEQQFALLNWNGQGGNGSARGNLLPKLLAAGFSVRLAHGLLDELMDYPDIGNDDKKAMNRIRTSLTEKLKAIESEDEILEKGGIYALVGTTGMGKTTTTAKLAARCVVRHGAEKLALLTTDGYRIGGHEQLRIYGKILGVTVHAVKDAQDLALALAELRGKHMVLIDTVGMSQRDQMVAEQVAMFAGCGTEVKRLLLLNASSSLHTLNEVAEAYRGNGLAGAIVTKLDEAVVSGCALDTAIRHRLPLYYVSSGQRVPEDLELASPGHLVNSTLDNSPAFPHALPGDALPSIIAYGKRTGVQSNMGGVGLD